MLGSLLQQLLLLQGRIPGKVKELYITHARNNTRPSVTELSKHLHTLLRCFSRVYFIIDGLDECDDTNKTRSVLLAQMGNLGNHVQLFFTSRPLEEVYPDSNRFNIVTQEDDMRKYLRTHIGNEPKLVTLCASTRGLRDEIINNVIAKADGMSVR